MRYEKLNICAVFLSLLALWSCGGKNTGDSQRVQHAKVDVYFFHTSYRCETCDAIKTETGKNLAELFGEDVYFGIYNLDKDGKEKARELGVKTLVLVAVKGDERINLTNEGFLYARAYPEKYRQVLEEKIKPLLE